MNGEGKADKETLTYERQDFWATTSNKQLNFLQHVTTLLKINGKAAVVVPENALFFDRKPASKKPWTEKLWIYDLRTNIHFTLKTNMLKLDDIKDFITCYNVANRHERKESERFKCFSYDELIQRDKASLDIFWLKDDSIEDSANLPDPDLLALEIADNVEAALEQFRGISGELGKD
jgi:type I restriction enzyme M protein